MKSEFTPAKIDTLREALLASRLHNPFVYLGRHKKQDGELV